MCKNSKKPIVFIDTSVFVAKKFSISGVAFSTLKKLCQAGEIKLVITEITRNEIYSKIKEQSQVIHLALKEFLREGGSLLDEEFNTLQTLTVM